MESTPPAIRSRPLLKGANGSVKKNRRTQVNRTRTGRNPEQTIRLDAGTDSWNDDLSR